MMLGVPSNWRRLSIVVAIQLTLLACGRSPIALDAKGGGVEVSVARSGEYAQRVARVRVSEAGSGRVVWEALAQDSASSLATFELRTGLNPALPEGISAEEFRAVGPAGFELVAGTRYSLETWPQGSGKPWVRQLVLKQGG